ncbi:MAG: HlyC/CorC family transporter [Nitrospinae bacterium]|nr:HlyC/CorC family transporter [Nitrospinota bacterium]
MSTTVLAITGIGLLIMANAWLAAAEDAVQGVQRGRLRPWCARDDFWGTLLARLCSDPGRLCGALRLGRALGAVLAGALVGLTAIEGIVPSLLTSPHPVALTTGQRLALGLVVVLVASLVLLLGELGPRALAVRGPKAHRPSGLIPAPSIASPTVPKLLEAGAHFRGSLPSRQIQDAPLEGGSDGSTQAMLPLPRLPFPEVLVREVMVPRPKVQALPLDSTPDAILTYLRTHQRSRYPVYGHSLDDLQGILYLKDVFVALARGEPLEVARLMRPALVVPETLAVGCLFQQFQHDRTQMGVVADERGAVRGVVTLEDLLEEIVGEIEDEFEAREVMIERLDEQVFLIDGTMLVRDLNRLCGFAIPESARYATLGGFLLAQFQHLPDEGEAVDDGEYTYTIVQMKGLRVVQVQAEHKRLKDHDGAVHG